MIPDMRTRRGHEEWCIARVRRNRVITDWEATANPKRAAAWNSLRDRGVIVVDEPTNSELDYPYNAFKIDESKLNADGSS